MGLEGDSERERIPFGLLDIVEADDAPIEKVNTSLKFLLRRVYPAYVL